MRIKFIADMVCISAEQVWAVAPYLTPLGSCWLIVLFTPSCIRFALYWGLSLLNTFGVFKVLSNCGK